MIEQSEHNLKPAEQEDVPAEELSFVDRHAIHPLIFSLTVLFLIFILYQIGGSVLMYLVTGSTSITHDNVWTVRWLTLLGQICFILLPTLLLTKLFSAKLRTVFPFRLPGLRESTFALIALFSLQRVFEVYMYFQEKIPLPQLLRDLIDPFRKILEEFTSLIVHAGSAGELFIVIILIAVIPSIVEELLFRGLVQKTFERLMSPVVSAILAGTIFGLYHFNPFEIVPLVGLGVFFGLLRYRSQSLWLPMAAHFFNNLMAVLASYYDIEDNTILTTVHGTSDISSMLLELFVFASIFFLAFVAYLRLTHDSSRYIK
jgi:membrane protease YdiL (CAAX protease family)